MTTNFYSTNQFLYEPKLLFRNLKSRDDPLFIQKPPCTFIDLPHRICVSSASESPASARIPELFL